MVATIATNFSMQRTFQQAFASVASMVLEGGVGHRLKHIGGSMAE
jgi:hypothetical protein